MYGVDTITAILIIVTVMLLMLFAIAVLVIIDHKAKIQSLTDDAFGPVLVRRNHPRYSFIITFVLFVIILALLFELIVAVSAKTGLFEEKIVEQKQIGLVKKIAELRFTDKKRHFHNEPKDNFVNQGKKPACFYCHGDYPHSTLPMVRSLLNMHTQFIGCMTCHNDPRVINEKTLSFGWLNYSGIEVSGLPYGTRINPATGFIVDTDDYYSKIVAYTSTNSGRKLLELTEESPDVRDFVELRGQFTDRERDIYKKALHKGVSPKGRFCTRCHSKENESYMPFRKLGFSEQRITDLTNTNIVGIVEKYREFYMPSLFKYTEPLPDVESLVGKVRKNSKDK